MSTIQATQGAGQVINTLLPSTNANPSTSTTASGSSAAGTEDRFLKLLVAQMRNQDPLNPMDNAQVTTQMAQISTVSGIESLNTTVKALLDKSGKNSVMDALGLIGRGVLTEGKTIARTAADAGAEHGGFVLPSAASSVQIQVSDATGAVVFQQNLGSTTAGTHQFTWDGTRNGGAAAAAGNYTIKVTATASGKNVPVTTLAPARVLGVSPGADGAVVELTGQRSLPADSIKAVF